MNIFGNVTKRNANIKRDSCGPSKLKEPITPKAFTECTALVSNDDHHDNEHHLQDGKMSAVSGAARWTM